MIRIILLSIFLLITSSEAKADFDLGAIWAAIAQPSDKPYAEDSNKQIQIYKGYSPLKVSRPLAAPEEAVEISEEINKAAHQVATVGLNKMVAGTGFVDVTFQVRDGVRYAMEDTFTGYAEYQRRKTLEEILNANAAASSITTQFLMISTGLKEESFGLMIFEDLKDIFDDYFAFPEYTTYSSEPLWRDARHHDMLQVSKNIIDKSIIKDLNGLIAGVAASILVLVFGFSVAQRMTNSHAGFSHVVSEPLMQKITTMIMIFASYYALHLCFDAAYFLNSNLHQFINNNGLDLSSIISIEALNNSWENISNTIGYFPALILSVVNMLAQIFVYIYIAGLLLQVILGFIISPLWAMATGVEGIEAAGIAPLLSWLKALLTLNFIPIIYMVFALINNELAGLNMDILNIAFSISALLLLPMVSKILLGETGSGFTRSAFWGYEMLLGSIESGYKQVTKLLEDQYQLQLATSQSPMRVRFEDEPIKIEHDFMKQLSTNYDKNEIKLIETRVPAGSDLLR